jgi:hypothetical protein
MTADPTIVFINANRVETPPGSTALDAVRRWDAAEAERIAAGERQLSDARGLPIDASSSVYGGAIYRVIGAKRDRTAAAPADPDA